jgi:type I restriction enzyme S subunit
MMISATSGFIPQSEKYATNNAGKSLEKYILLEKNELAYNHGASKLRPFGSCFALSVKEARIPFVYHCFSIERSDPGFASIQLNSDAMQRQLRGLVSSGARMDGLLNISFDEYTSVKMYLPSLEEQRQITILFDKCEQAIVLHQRLFFGRKYI